MYRCRILLPAQQTLGSLVSSDYWFVDQMIVNIRQDPSIDNVKKFSQHRPPTADRYYYDVRRMPAPASAFKVFYRVVSLIEIDIKYILPADPVPTVDRWYDWLMRLLPA